MKKKLAFTLIEILIAISVFAIGILAVLRVLTGNLSTLDTANIKLQATVLAKE
ncbi:prepilin-type N-terminal cleavage/methylation domain-containing protein [bacterium]|jgi:prepilin-type N-terminal cleavage/methylation domain-containing protein|nr:prepilin-type N-terminal cleavage/methylation domain-containing protein [bacterium]